MEASNFSFLGSLTAKFVMGLCWKDATQDFECEKDHLVGTENCSGEHQKKCSSQFTELRADGWQNVPLEVEIIHYLFIVRVQRITFVPV